MTVKKKYPLLVILSVLVIIFVVIFIDGYISSYSSDFVSDRIEDVPFNRCGLLLGTSKYRVEGGINPFFSNRLDAAADLYRTGRIDCIIASGDNSAANYNEPRAMMQGLRERGIPAEKIYLDYAGFRTLDSVVRAREIFSQNSVTVISQRFHNERAVYIGRKWGIEIYGYNASGSDDSGETMVRLREIFARLKAFIDVNFTMERPKFLGEKVKVD